MFKEKILKASMPYLGAKDLGTKNLARSGIGRNSIQCKILSPSFKNIEPGAGEMAWHLGSLTTLSEDRSLNPSTHIGWHSSACNSSSKGSHGSFCLHWVFSYTHAHRNTLMNE